MLDTDMIIGVNLRVFHLCASAIKNGIFHRRSKRIGAMMRLQDRSRVLSPFVSLQEIFSGDAGLSADSSECRRFYPVMIRYRHRGFRAISVCAFQGDILLFPNQAKPQHLKGLHYSLLRRVYRELRYGHYTPASATKASRIGGSTSRTDGPKVSM